MAATGDVIMLLWLPWKLNKQQMVSINRKIKRTLINLCQISSESDELDVFKHSKMCHYVVL